eukprot:1922789-Pleurochrysis_carterae.AAC.1
MSRLLGSDAQRKRFVHRSMLLSFQADLSLEERGGRSPLVGREEEEAAALGFGELALLRVAACAARRLG